MKTFDVSAVGFLVLDVLGRPVSAMPPEGGATFIDEIVMTVAGTAGATALDCAILGLKGQISARVGDDPMGDFLVSEMAKHGLDCGLVQRDEKLQTPCSMLPIRPSGERSAFFVPGASKTFLPTKDDVAAICEARFVHVGGTGLLDAFDGPPTLDLLGKARAAGCTTVFDLILADAAVTEKVVPLLPLIDFFVPSIEEARAMSGGTEADGVARWFRERGARNVILTLGGDGVFVDPVDAKPFELPALAADVVDTTGCGDSFTAGIIAGLAHDMALGDAARFANAVAAQVAMGLGSQGRLTSFERTVQLMTEN